MREEAPRGPRAEAFPRGPDGAEAPHDGARDAGVTERDRERTVQKPKEPRRRVAERKGATRVADRAGRTPEAPVRAEPPAAAQAKTTASQGRKRGRSERAGVGTPSARDSSAGEKPERAVERPYSPAEAMREASELAGAGSCALPRFLQTWREREATRVTKQHDRADDREDAPWGFAREARRRGRTATTRVGKPKGIFPVAPPRREVVRALMAERVSAEAVETGVDLVMDALGAACWVACGSTPSVPRNLRAADSPAMESVIAMAVEAAACAIQTRAVRTAGV